MSNKIIPKNYGSIPHLSTSKIGQQADKKIEIGQEKMLTQKSRDWKDLIIVTEKLDGSNVGIVNLGGILYPIIRSGYHANNSNFKFHHRFTRYVCNNGNMFSWLPDGWRIAGEWLTLAHGTIYDITKESPFCAFDIFNESNERICYIDFIRQCSKYNIPTVPLLHIGQPISIENAVKLLGKGHYGNPDKPEGFVYRLERDGKVEFLAKWVQADKEDGKYLDSNIWNKTADYTYCQ